MRKNQPIFLKKKNDILIDGIKLSILLKSPAAP